MKNKKNFYLNTRSHIGGEGGGREREREDGNMYLCCVQRVNFVTNGVCQ